MKVKFSIALIVAAGLLAATLAILHPPGQKAASEPEQAESSPATASPELAQPQAPEPITATRPTALVELESTVSRAPSMTPAAPVTTNKLERLAQTRESFRLLAAGDPTSAMRAAKQITNETERETALLTLV